MDLFDSYLIKVILDALIPILVGLAVGWIAQQWAKITGRNMEARDREALHSALQTGVNAALNRYVYSRPATQKVEVNGEIIDIIVEEAESYVRRSVPDAIRRFNPTNGVLKDLIISKLPFKL